MLEVSLETLRGPKRTEAQKRLGILKQDMLGDRGGRALRCSKRSSRSIPAMTRSAVAMGSSASSSASSSMRRASCRARQPV